MTCSSRHPRPSSSGQAKEIPERRLDLVYFAVKMSPDGAHLGDEEGHEEGGKGGK